MKKLESVGGIVDIEKRTIYPLQKDGTADLNSEIFLDVEEIPGELMDNMSNEDYVWFSSFMGWDDLVEQYQKLPQDVQDILNEEEQADVYAMRENQIERLEKLGFTADYDLGGVMYDLKLLKL